MMQRLVTTALVTLQVLLLGYELVAKFDTHGRQVALAITNAASIGLFFVVQHVIRKRYGIVINWVVLLVVCVGIWLDAVGNFLHYYGRYWWWDHVTHAVGGLAITTGFVVVSVALWRVGRLKVSWFVVNLYAFCVAQTLAALYEVSEWIGDALFKTNRVGGQFDTPRDLFFNMIGGLIVIAVAYLWRIRYRAVNAPHG